MANDILTELIKGIKRHEDDPSYLDSILYRVNEIDESILGRILKLNSQLQKIANDISPRVRVKVVSKLADHELFKYYKDPAEEVKLALIERGITTIFINDPSEKVRCTLAYEHYNLDFFINDSSEYVREAVAYELANEYKTLLKENKITY